MISKWPAWSPPPRTSHDTGGHRIYAIGDVHGRADLLDEMLAAIRNDWRTSATFAPTSRPLIVFLGDYIDRGPASRDVIERLLQVRDDAEFTTIPLLGNHEQMLLDFLGGSQQARGWAALGGLETLASYGVFPDRRAVPAWDGAREALMSALPLEHHDFLRTLEAALHVGSYIFVHAGLRPGRALTEQALQDLLWIRKPFTGTSNPCPPYIVVHGHTPSEAPVRTAGRIGIDTGAYVTGKLTAVRLDDGQVAFAQTGLGRTPIFEASD